MKQKLFALLLLFACVGNAWGLRYKLDATTKTAMVTRNDDESFTTKDNLPYSGEVVIPETVEYNGEVYKVTSIRDFAFQYYAVKSVTIPENMEVGSNAFNGCNNISETTVILSGFDKFCDGTWRTQYMKAMPSSMKSFKLYYNNKEVTNYIIPEGVTSIALNAFQYCNNLTAISIPQSVTSIASVNFKGCSSLAELTLHSNEIYTLASGNEIPNGCVIYVQSSLLSDYREAEFWSDHRAQFISIGVQTEYEVTVEAKTTMSSIHEEIGEDNLINVVSLKVNGTINSYDLMIMRNKMVNLKHLDLSDARILTCAYEYYQGYHSEEDTWTRYAFNPNLMTLKLPNTLVTCGEYAVVDMVNLQELKIPSSVTSIKSNFARVNNVLQRVYFDDDTQLSSIGTDAFAFCGLKYIELEKITKMTYFGSIFQGSNLNVTIPACVTTLYWPAQFNKYTEVTFADGDEILNITNLSDPVLIYKVYLGRKLSIPQNKTMFDGYQGVNLTIGDKVTELLQGLLRFKTDAIYLYGMKNVTKIQDNAFIRDANTSISKAATVFVDYAGSVGSWCSIENISNLTASSFSKVARLTINGTTDFDFDPEDDLEVINRCSFYGIEGIRSLSIPGSVKTIGGSAFRGCVNMTSVTIGNSVENIEYQAFDGCSSLASLTIGNSVKNFGNRVFWGCTSLTEVNLPSTLTTMGSYAFAGCNNMTSCVLPTNSQLIEIPDYAFDGCTALQKMDMPVSVQKIGNYAFRGCTSMEETRIPSSIRSIGGYAFNGSSKLNDVYTYTVIPQKIDQNTFSTYHTATLHVPAISYYNYYYDTQWSQFLNLVNFNEPYTYVFIDKDFEINTDKKIIEGCPLFEILNTAGLKLKGAASQTFSEIRLKADRLKAASLIARAELTANMVYIDIDVQKNMWEFFTFPFDVDLTQVQKEGNYVFRRYDGNLRAQNGSGGWQDITDNKLKAGVGYIFRTDTDGTLSIPFTDPNLQAVNVKQALEGYTKSEGDTPAKDKNWNFVGNPYTSYYNINDLDYSAPIVCWDVQQQKYVAYRPGDDDFVLRPFQPFFLQKGEDVDYVGYAEEARVTGTEAEEEQANGAKRRARARRMNQNRQLINLTLSDGKTEDKTRVVFNNEQLMTYEIGCDVVKMASLANTFQLYTVGNDGTKYAINERPQGDGFVQLGYVAPEAGTFTLSATRMDVPVIVHDNLEGITFNLAEGNYSFQTEAGSFADRFAISMAQATAIDSVTADENAAAGNGEDAATYDISGRAVSKDAKGIVIKGGKKVLVK